MTFNGSNRKQVREREKELAIRTANRLAETAKIMGTKYGRQFMHDLLERCHCWATSFVAGAPDTTSFRLGEQNIGLQIFADVIAAAPQEYVQMMSEAKERELINERRYSDERATDGQRSGSEGSIGDADNPGPGAVTEYDPYADGRPEDPNGYN
jgi:hypothetical protein